MTKLLLLGLVLNRKSRQMDPNNCKCHNSSITEGEFGEIQTGPGDQIFNEPLPKIVKSYTLKNNNRMEVTVITWGATIVSIKCPDKYGKQSDVMLGFDKLEGYTNIKGNPFIGCILGRCANRIKDGYCKIKGKDYILTRNNLGSTNHLHGGINGFGRRVWESYIADCCVVMSYLSQDGEEGYPGALLATVRFQLTQDNKLEISMRATTSKPTIVNLSYGSMFNLAGHDAGEVELRKHKIMLNCDRWTVIDGTDPIPTGVIQKVDDTCMDLRIPRVLGEYMDKVPSGEGYDHNLCVTRCWQSGSVFVGKIWHQNSGRIMEVYSDQPGVQLYTCGRLIPELDSESTSTFDNCWLQAEDVEEGECCASDMEKSTDDAETMKACKNDGSHEVPYILGKNGTQYKKYCAFSIQPQNYPNAINYKQFPCSLLHPGQVYCHDLTYKFGVCLTSLK